MTDAAARLSRLRATTRTCCGSRTSRCSAIARGARFRSTRAGAQAAGSNAAGATYHVALGREASLEGRLRVTTPCRRRRRRAASSLATLDVVDGASRPARSLTASIGRAEMASVFDDDIRRAAIEIASLTAAPPAAPRRPRRTPGHRRGRVLQAAGAAAARLSTPSRRGPPPEASFSDLPARPPTARRPRSSFSAFVYEAAIMLPPSRSAAMVRRTSARAAAFNFVSSPSASVYSCGVSPIRHFPLTPCCATGDKRGR